MNSEQLQDLHQAAEKTLAELMDLLNHTPKLAGEIKPLIQSTEILAAFQSMCSQDRELAEQLLRLTLATTVNYHTSVETARRLAEHS